MTGRLEVTTRRWPRVVPGDDLARLLVDSGSDLSTGDVVAITSKVVSKSEGRYAPADRAHAIAAETRREVARRGPLVVTESRHGIVQANAGVDSSNVEPGSQLMLPVDPDSSARKLRRRLLELTEQNVAVVVTDTMGRAWRLGHVDQAVGCAGMDPLVDLAGVVDPYGNRLEVTMPAIADEVSAAADLAKGKTTGCPAAVVRGLGHLVLPPGEDGPGASALHRPPGSDLFGWGAREAVLAALRRGPDDLAHFAVPDADDVRSVLLLVGALPEGVRLRVEGDRVAVGLRKGASPLEAGRVVERLVTALAAHRLQTDVDTDGALDRDAIWQTVAVVRLPVAYTLSDPGR